LLQLRGAIRQGHLHFWSRPGHVVGPAQRNALSAAGVPAAARPAQGPQGCLLKTRKSLLCVSFIRDAAAEGTERHNLFILRSFQRRFRRPSMRPALHVRGEPPSGPSGQSCGLAGGTAQTRFHVRHNLILLFLGVLIESTVNCL
jgi:hypothetical protein